MSQLLMLVAVTPHSPCLDIGASLNAFADHFPCAPDFRRNTRLTPISCDLGGTGSDSK